MSTEAAKAGVTVELRRQAGILIELADRLDTLNEPPQPAPPAQEIPIPSRGSVMVAAERLRSLREKGHTAQRDALYTGTELGWAAYTYLERAAQDRLPQGDPSIPHIWPLHRDLWKPKHTVIRNLIIAANLIVAEIDRRLEAGEKP